MNSEPEARPASGYNTNLKPPPPPIPPRRRGLDDLLATIPQSPLANMLAAANMPAPVPQSSPSGPFAEQHTLRHQPSFRSLQPRRSMHVIKGEQQLRKYSSQPSLKRCRSLDSRRSLYNINNRSSTLSSAGSIRRVPSALDLASVCSLTAASAANRTPSPILADYASIRSRSRGSIYRRNYFIPLLHVLPEQQLQNAAVKTVLARHVVDETDLDRVPAITICQIVPGDQHQEELVAVQTEIFPAPTDPMPALQRRSVLLGDPLAASYSSRPQSPAAGDDDNGQEPLVVALELMEYQSSDYESDDCEEDKCNEIEAFASLSNIATGLTRRPHRSAFDAALQSAVDASHLLTGNASDNSENEADDADEQSQGTNFSETGSSDEFCASYAGDKRRALVTGTSPGTIYLPTMSLHASRKWLTDPIRKRTITKMINDWPVQIAGILRIHSASKTFAAELLPSSLRALSWKRYWVELRQGCLFFYKCPRLHRSTAERPRSAEYPIAYLPIRSATIHTLSDRLTRKRIFRLDVEERLQYFVQAASVAEMHNWWLDITAFSVTENSLGILDSASASSPVQPDSVKLRLESSRWITRTQRAFSTSAALCDGIRRSPSSAYRRTNSDSHTLVTDGSLSNSINGNTPSRTRSFHFR